ncbi:BTAD domain-containing putative transcriptional regulator [Amycolatopsis sp. WQ 127309]|uniref:BTAD domain-containing putative transcriptional regulator n=1 Tax=Amycolatopsis sp. WQ 127309 TaxID=2932773 RepID=UPI001FF37C8B|nr:BTAD domain-containing putative transcriptional regulator [Amycolatopsis sp. WQ 127309]UOZ06948.1 AAA family ATPase [Amycolatopsis sp. WQ 127309]
MRLQFELFGEIRAWRDGDEVGLGPALRRTVLTVLALRANRTVTRSELIDAVWGEHPPASATGSIYTYVSALRSALEPGRAPQSAGAVLISGASGYCLRIPPESIDVVRFETLRDEGRRRYRAFDPAGAVAAFDNALGLYRGEPLAELPGPFVAAQRERLGELRLDVVERRAKALLDLGEHARVVTDLSDVAAQYPMHENLQDLLLVALYRCGRREEALEIFESVRARTVQELGTEPGRDLTAHYEQIKADDPALRLPGHGAARLGGSSSRRLDRSAAFVGREAELNSLRSAVAAVASGCGGVLWVEGEPGIGKSALVAEALAETPCPVGTAVADEFSDRSPLRMVLDCLSARPTTPDLRRAALATVVKTAATPEAGVDAVIAFVRQLCEEAPLVLFADDLHWADSTSLLAWRRLARLCGELPLLLIGSYRSTPANIHLDDLCGRVGEVCTLGALSDREADELFTTLLDDRAEPAPAELAATAGGNPQYLVDLATAWCADGTLAGSAGDDRPAIPASVGAVVKRRLAFLSARSREAARWAAMFGPKFSPLDLAAALDRSASEIEPVQDELLAAGVLVRTGDWLRFRHPVVRQALYATMPLAIRLALHRQLAEMLHDAGAPVEQVAAHLLAAPVPVDPWLRDWVLREAPLLAPRSPESALRLIERVKASGMITDTTRERLTLVRCRVLTWLGRDAAAEAERAAATATDPDVLAELRWIIADSAYRRGDVPKATAVGHTAFEDVSMPPLWHKLHTALLARSLELDTVCPPPAATPTGTIPRQRPAGRVSPADAYLTGDWAKPLGELSRALRNGPTTAAYLLGPPGELRRLKGAAALIACHRDQPRAASAHLLSAWAGSADPAGAHADGSDFLYAAGALLAERRGEPGHALDLLVSLLATQNGVVCRWMPLLVRLATELGEEVHAKNATLLCERTPGEETAGLHCRALLAGKPEAALAAAGRHQAAGNHLGRARALEDGAVLLADQGRWREAAAALRSALSEYQDLGASWDISRAITRNLPDHDREPS